MSKGRFIFQNLITDESMLSVSSNTTGMVTDSIKSGTGAAVLITSGDYTGSTDLGYILEIDGVGTGEVGSSTFKWSDTDGATWNATSMATSASDITLSNGVKVKWTAGTGADFVLADSWSFKGVQPFSAGKMIDLDRDHRCRSATLSSPNTITFNGGEDIQPFVLIIYDHNLTSAATISLLANTSNSFSVPLFEQSIPWASSKILAYLIYPTITDDYILNTDSDTIESTDSDTVGMRIPTHWPNQYQYWQLQITDTTNPAGYIEIGELFLGSYLELSKNYIKGFANPLDLLINTNKTPYGTRRDRFYNSQRTRNIDFKNMPSSDVASMVALVDAISSRSTGKFNPIWFNADSALTNQIWMGYIDGLKISQNANTLNDYDISLNFTEAMTSL
jgi:hypothetical protein